MHHNTYEILSLRVRPHLQLRGVLAKDSCCMALRQVLRSDVPVSFADINKFAQSKSVSEISNANFSWVLGMNLRLFAGETLGHSTLQVILHTKLFQFNEYGSQPSSISQETIVGINQRQSTRYSKNILSSQRAQGFPNPA